MMSFHRAVHRLVRAIPRGRVASYGQIAEILGAPRAARAVGYAMRHCPPGVPWHRVVNARGAISRRANAAGMLTQRVLLQQEGVPIRGSRIVHLDRHRWRGRREARQPSASPRGESRIGRRDAEVSAVMALIGPPEAARPRPARGRTPA